MKRNTIVIGVTLFILAGLAWAGWANWEYRKQAAERALASASHAELIPATAGDVPQSQTSLIGKPAPVVSTYWKAMIAHLMASNWRSVTEAAA